MRKFVAVIIMVALMLIMTACAGGARGQIISKSYTPPYTTFIPICGKYGCSVIPVFHPECYGIYLDDKNQTQRCIPKPLWDSLPVGSYYDSEKYEEK